MPELLLGVYNTKDDLDKLNEAINNCKKVLTYNELKRIISRNNFRSWKES